MRELSTPGLSLEADIVTGVSSSPSQYRHLIYYSDTAYFSATLKTCILGGAVAVGPPTP